MAHGVPFVLTTHPGLEDVVVDELKAISGGGVDAVVCPGGRAGWVRVGAHWVAPNPRDDRDRMDEPPDLGPRLDTLRSVHRVIRIVAEGPLPEDNPVEALARWTRTLSPDLFELDPPDTTFRVRCDRRGVHPFTSEDVERACGAGVRAGRWRPVDLRNPAVEVRVDIDKDQVRIGVTAGRSRSLRADGPFRPATALRPNLAWALCALARPDGVALRVLDPFVGSGTILIEAAARWPQAELCGSDREARCVDGARNNLAHAGLPGEVRLGDARRLRPVWPAYPFDTIVTDPPFGRRHGADTDLGALYRDFLAGAAEICTPDARLVVLVLRRGVFNRALRAVGRWEILHVRIVEVGGLYAGVFVLGAGRP